MRFQGLDLNLLVALDVLIETRSVTETSRRLNLSQPAISAALSRLREYFDDQLLTQIGKQMVPTAKAQDLASAISEMLAIARFRITQVESFDPAQSTRQFRLIASDYVFDTLLSRCIARASEMARDVTFDIRPPGPLANKSFEKGEVDLMITVSRFQREDHPAEIIFDDEDVVICWAQGRHASGVDHKTFLDAEFAVAVFGDEQRPTVSDIHFEESNIARRIAVRVPSFSALPASVVGTNRLAIMHRRHALLFKALYPITMHEVPGGGAGITQVAQWHRLRNNDAGIRWLLTQLKEQAAIAFA